ncbi:TlpA family protein disulfide reductase [Undibacterium squillarum]|uniref:Thioredoxin n=1 Tax=Undibacterium squillarum TaxID=1131567 RepID=A0ABQ2XVD5_9BURK|nr:TlpA disulfide reductase family protein [Undibacterium squillarum]GGX36161.1 thioredoxin [Undibacterium squillarum]
MRFVSGLKRFGLVSLMLLNTAISPLTQAAEYEYLQLPNLSLASGDKFPLKQLTDLSGKALSEQQFQGKYVLINFYSEHCAPCIREVPVLNQIMLRNKDIHVLAITPDKAEEAKQYLQQYALQWPVAAGADQLLFNQIGVKSFPSFALLDRNGKLVTTVYANQLGGEDGNATLEGIEKWLRLKMRSAKL